MLPSVFRILWYCRHCPKRYLHKSSLHRHKRREHPHAYKAPWDA